MVMADGYAGISTGNLFRCRAAMSAVPKRSDLYASMSVPCWILVCWAFGICVPVSVTSMCWAASTGTPHWPVGNNTVSVLALCSVVSWRAGTFDQRDNSEYPNKCFQQHLKEKKEDIWLIRLTKSPSFTKSKATTQKRHQKLRLHNDFGSTNDGDSVK